MSFRVSGRRIFRSRERASARGTWYSATLVLVTLAALSCDRVPLEQYQGCVRERDDGKKALEELRASDSSLAKRESDCRQALAQAQGGGENAISTAIADETKRRFDDFSNNLKIYLPEQVKSTVDAELDGLRLAMVESFRRLEASSRTEQSQLMVQSQSIAALGEAVSDTRSNLAHQLEVAQDEVRHLKARESAAVRLLEDFDKNRIQCRSCTGRLHLNRKEIEAIEGAHALAIEALASEQQ